jgi:hypothetical protein
LLNFLVCLRICAATAVHIEVCEFAPGSESAKLFKHPRDHLDAVVAASHAAADAGASGSVDGVGQIYDKITENCQKKTLLDSFLSAHSELIAFNY